MIPSGDPFTLLKIIYSRHQLLEFLLPMAAISFSQKYWFINFNALRMNGLPSNLVVCCKTIYFNSSIKLQHLIIYSFHSK